MFNFLNSAVSPSCIINELRYIFFVRIRFNSVKFWRIIFGVTVIVVCLNVNTKDNWKLEVECLLILYSNDFWVNFCKFVFIIFWWCRKNQRPFSALSWITNRRSFYFSLSLSLFFSSFLFNIVTVTKFLWCSLTFVYFFYFSSLFVVILDLSHSTGNRFHFYEKYMK